MTQIDYIIEKAKRELPSRLRKAPWQILDHGKNLLGTPDEMNAYLSAYGEMHKVKCYAALQNFPYERLPQRIHIVDWGCGQGLGTICMLDNLYVRGLVGRVKKITLIEPSPVTLERAEFNVRSAMQHYNPDLETIGCYLPSEMHLSPTLQSLTMNLPGTIHIFSNILDIPSVSLRKTAQIIESGNGIQFVVCTAPVNANSPRLDEFCKYFGNSTLFSDILDTNFGYTSDTDHKFGCKTKGFFFESQTSILRTDVKEKTYSESGAFDDYDLDAMVRNGLLSASVFQAYQTLSSHLRKNDRIFLKPNLNGDTPDIIVVRPGIGILVLDVFEENPNDCMFNSKGEFCVANRSVASPLSRVYSYRDNIINQYSTEILKKTVTDKSAWFIVRPAVWFPNYNRLQVDALFAKDLRPQGDPKRHIVSGVITISCEEFSVPDFWGHMDFKYENRCFTDTVCSQFLSVVRSQWHCFNEGDNEVKLTPRQLELAKSYSGRVIRVKGVAGSGKTQVLASTAVNCQLRTGRPVLILTYNITLVNYIRYRIGRVPADFPWSKFTITNYHCFFNSQARNQDLRLNLSSYDDEGFFNDVTDKLPKYSAILIDEAQDYKRSWFSILFNYFLEPDGEVAVFGDKNQDVYRRNTFDSIPQVRNHVWGRWNELKLDHRVNNQVIVDLAKDFQQEYFGSVDDIEENRKLVFGGGTAYSYVSPDCPPDVLVKMALDYISKQEIDPSKTVILSQTTDVLRLVEYSIRCSTGQHCMTTFETKEVYEALLKAVSGKVKTSFKEELEKVRTNKKAHFTMLSEKIKMSTIYSYKGWDASCVILLILTPPPHPDALENRPELIYTAITRASDYLYVINLGNQTYHGFFQQHI